MHILSWPAVYALELTPACNNHCLGCSNVYQEHRSSAPTSAVQWEAWLAQFGPEAVRFRLTGGEPTLHPEFIRIAQAALSYDAHVTVFTNGRWTHPAALIAQLVGRPNLMGFLVSLHGARAATHEAFTCQPDSFAETIANAQRALDAGIGVALCTVINRHNYDEIDEMIELAERLGVEHVAFNRYLGFPQSEIEADLPELRAAVQQIEQRQREGHSVRFGNGVPQCFVRNHSEGCLAGAAYVSIDPWGNVHPCPRSPTNVGSLHESALWDLWHGAAMTTWRALLQPTCQECAAYPVCHGGCRVMQEVRPDQRDPLCRQALKRYAAPTSVCELPAEARPRAELRIREEEFGFVLLGHGQAVPIQAQGLPLVAACDGQTSFAELADRFGMPGLDLLGTLWQLNMLDTS